MVETRRSLTHDTLFEGKLTVCQEREGYRFSIDAVLLAGLTDFSGGDRIIELGTGCGVIPIVLAHRRVTSRKIFGIEIQPELARLALENAEANRLDDRIDIRLMDLRQVSICFDPASFDLVLSNPPYRKPGSGRINPDRQKAIARHELSSNLSDFFAAAAHLLPQSGRTALIYPASRIAHLFNSAHENGFTPKRLTIIHSRPGDPGRLVHLECRKGGGEEVRIEPPFYIYEDGAHYSPAMKRLYEE
ncbi:MAG: methyltransferase [Syntrophobacteraceae bacterium]